MGNSNHRFNVKTGVRQGCVMSAFLFNIAIDWVMRRTTENQSRGVRWTLFSTLEDLDFADDLALISHTHQHIQDKTYHLNKYAEQIGLRINLQKTEVMTLNIPNPQPVQINGENLPMIKDFTYLGSIIRYDGGVDNDTYPLSTSRNQVLVQSQCYCQFLVGSTCEPFKNRLLFHRLESQYRARTYVTEYVSCFVSLAR